MSKKVIILGAGLSGLSCGWHLDRSVSYEIYEKEKTVGGLCRTVEQDGFLFDFTGHLLHFQRPDIRKIVFKALRNNLIEHIRNSWIYSYHTFTRYPYQANTYGLPLAVRKECVIGFLNTRLQRPAEKRDTLPESFYQWALRHFGKGIGKHFLFGYNEKLWTINAHALTAEWTGAYVPQPTIAEVIEGAFSEQQKAFGYNASFWYPLHGGIQMLPKAVASSLSSLFLAEKAITIDLPRKTVLFASGKATAYDFLVSTMSIVELIRIVKGVPPQIKNAASHLRYSAVLNINIGVSPALKNNIHWIYFPEKRYPFYRAGIASNFTPYNHPARTSSIYMEIAHCPGTIDYTDKKLIRRMTRICIDRLRSTGILKESSKVITTCILPIEPGYCIYDRQRTRNLELIQDYLRQNNIFSIGRYGAWEYSAMEDAWYWGKITAEKIRGKEE